MKKVWLSATDASQDAVRKIMSTLKTYGLDVDGHFWEDNLDKHAWIKPRKEMLDKKISLWIIVGSAKSLESFSIRYGLTLLAISLQATLEAPIPIVILQTDKEPLAPEDLPAPLSGVDILPADSRTAGAKIVAKLHLPLKKQPSPYRLDVYAMEGIGQWFEVGPPPDDSWQGAIFGVCGAEIKLHAVGVSGQLPEKSVLNYPMQGLELEAAGRKFTAWAVQNPLPSGFSYYVKVEGTPSAILFCPFAQEDDTEAHLIILGQQDT